MAVDNLSPVRADETAAIAELLAHAGLERGGDVVDEGELARLQGQRTLADWEAVVARDGDEVIGYAGLVVGDDGTLSGDVVSLSAPDVIGPLLTWQRERTGDRPLVTWLRFASERELAVVAEAGFAIRRRLGVLGRSLDDVDGPTPSEDITIRAVTIDDLDGVLAVLLDAYDGTDDAGWSREELTHRRAYPWYRDEDLLVAVTDDDRVAGIHWTKRRTPETGEVYNLAIAPWAQGRGLGRDLLLAGMTHLAQVGEREILLWVDRRNERALQLYEAAGFETRWDDVALAPE